MRGKEKLNIRWEQGYKGSNDRRYFIADVVVTIRDTLKKLLLMLLMEWILILFVRNI